jgi:hypothetical protein
VTPRWREPRSAPPFPRQNEPRRTLKLVAVDICEPAIVCHQDAILGATDPLERWVSGAGKLLFVNRQGIPAFAAKEMRDFLWQIFVYFEAHQAGNARDSSRARSAA